MSVSRAIILSAACCLWAFSGLTAQPGGGVQDFRSDGGVASSAGSLPENLDSAEALRWRIALDSGHSTPIIDGGKIFLTTWRAQSKELATVALDEASGKVLWRNPLVPEHIEQVNPSGNPAMPTVACDGKRIFAFFGTLGMFCYDLDGHKLWEQKLGPFQDEYGAASSPVLFDGKVIVNQDHDADSFLMAMDCASGRVVWKVARPDAVRSYSTPSIWMRDGRPELLVPGALQLTAYDPANGQRLWWINGLARIVIPAPVISGPMIYMASWSPRRRHRQASDFSHLDERFGQMGQQFRWEARQKRNR